MNKQELLEVLKTIRDQADEYAASEDIEFIICYNEEVDIIFITCEPYHTYTTTKQFNAREEKEVLLEMVLYWLQERYEDEVSCRLEGEEEEEEMERREEYDREVDDLADNLQDLVDDYNSDCAEPPFSLIIQTPYRFVIRAEINEEETYDLTIDCDEYPDPLFDPDQLLQEARDFCEKRLSD
jgi:hypothetical protein